MEMRPVKCVIVGDGAFLKITMLLSLLIHKKINLGLWDTAGQEEYDRLRPLSYPNTDVFIICYSITARSSFENVEWKWKPEVANYSPDVPIVLVGTKSDIREDGEQMNRLKNQGSTLISQEEGYSLAEKIGAEKFIECSALTQENLRVMFEESVRCAIQKKQTVPKKNSHKRKCHLF
ncbi:Ras-like GTP-binding protein RHO [Entamoeba marina]